MLNKLKLNTRLLLVMVSIAMLPFLTLSLLSLQNSSEALHEKVFAQNLSVRETKLMQIQNKIHTIRNQAKTLSNSTMIVDAMRSFQSAHQKLEKYAFSDAEKSKMRKGLFDYYSNSFQPKYKSLNNDNQPPGLRGKFDQLSNAGLRLQHLYISSNNNSLGSKHLLDRAGDESDYSTFHEKYHPVLRHYLETYGYYDIFLVDGESGEILYSVFKELDFGTSLIGGPYANTNIGEAFRQAKNSSDPDFVRMVDLEPYFPSYEYPAGFVSSPIFDGDKKVGVLILQIPVEQIDAIMTNNNKWAEVGMGASGETYLVGPDLKMRSNSRFLVEKKEEYLNFVSKLGMRKEVLDDVRVKETSVIHQVIDTKAVKEALKGNSGEDIVPDYRGVNVVSAYTPLNLPDLNWVLLAEVDESEAFASTRSLKILIVAVLILGALLIVVVSVLTARSVSKPIMNVIMKLSEGAEQVTSASVQVSSSSQHMAEGANEQASSLEETSSSLEEMSSMIRQNADNAKEASTLSGKAKAVADTGGQSINRLMEAMDKIQNSSVEMAKIIKTIDEIAFQTNILSLNAAVEAARAGEAGKGFAVVAEEVRNLAQRSAEAANSTSELIEGSQENAQNGVSVSKEVEISLREIVDSIDKVSQLISEVAAAGTEQSQGIEQLNTAVAQMDKVTQSNASNAEESASASEELSAQAKELNDMVLELNAVINGKNATLHKNGSASKEKFRFQASHQSKDILDAPHLNGGAKVHDSEWKHAKPFLSRSGKKSNGKFEHRLDLQMHSGDGNGNGEKNHSPAHVFPLDDSELKKF